MKSETALDIDYLILRRDVDVKVLRDLLYDSSVMLLKVCRDLAVSWSHYWLRIDGLFCHRAQLIFSNVSARTIYLSYFLAFLLREVLIENV